MGQSRRRASARAAQAACTALMACAALTACAALGVPGRALGAAVEVNADRDRLPRISPYADVQGPVKRVRVRDYSIRMPFGVPAVVAGYVERDDEYDLEGRLARREHIYRAGAASMIIEYVYDAAGNCTAEICRYNSTRPAYVERNTYDEDGHLIETERTDQSGRISYRLFCNYDDDGHKLSETRLNRDGMLRSRRVFDYDEDGHLIESLIYDPDGRLTYRTTYEYDEQGRVTAMRTMDGQGNVGITAKYAYDEHDVVRRSVSTAAIGRTVSVYNEHGDMVASALHSADEDTLLVRLVRLYGYDEHGNEVACLELRTSVSVFGRPILLPYYAVITKIDYYGDEK